MKRTQNIVALISTSLFGLILIYSFIISIFYSYQGEHWVGQVNLLHRLFLNFILLFIVITFIFCFVKYSNYIYSKLIAFTQYFNGWKVFGMALFLRFLWVIFSNVTQSSDFIIYNNVSVDILNGNSILLYLDSARTVGPSIFIAAHYWLFGQNEIFPLMSIAILSSMQVLFVYLIVSKLFYKSIGVLAALFLVVFPEHILITNLLGSDVIFSFFIYLSLFIIFKAYDEKNRFQLILFFLSGITIGLAHWTRATAQIFLISFLVFILISQNFKGIVRILYGLLFILGFFVICSPIIIHNNNTYNRFDLSPIHGQLGKSLLIGTLITGQGRAKGWSKYENHDSLKNAVDNYLILSGLTTLENIKSFRQDNKSTVSSIEDNVFSQIAFQRIFKSPADFILLVLKYKIVNFWGIVAGLSFSLDTSRVRTIKPIIWAFADIWQRFTIALCGLVLMTKIFLGLKLWDIRQGLLIAGIIFTFAHLFLESHPRYHHVFLPFLAMYIGEIIILLKLKGRLRKCG